MSRQKFIFTLFVAILAFADAAHHEEDNDEGNIYFRTFKKAARFVFRRKKTGGQKQDLGPMNGFQLELRYLRQKDGNGTDTGEPITTFADHTFSLSSFNRRAEIQGVKAADIKATTNLKKYHAKLSVRIIIFREEGNVTFGNESYGVQMGTIKLFIKVENFTFCDGRTNRSMCKENTRGEFLEIGIRVRNRKGEAGRQETENERNKREGDRKQRLRCFKQRGKNKCPRIFLFGKDEVGVASQCETDNGTFISQAPGFPKLSGNANNQMLLFRGPRFNRTITFDPVMELAEDDDEGGDENGDNENHASTVYINVSLFVAILGTMFL